MTKRSDLQSKILKLLKKQTETLTFADIAKQLYPIDFRRHHGAIYNSLQALYKRGYISISKEPEVVREVNKYKIKENT